MGVESVYGVGGKWTTVDKITGAIMEIWNESNFRLIYIIMRTPVIHWLTYISIRYQTINKPSATTKSTKVNKSVVSHMGNGITI